jgi:hypothetical protein
MSENIQQLFNFGLKFMGLCLFFHLKDVPPVIKSIIYNPVFLIKWEKDIRVSKDLRKNYPTKSYDPYIM